MPTLMDSLPDDHNTLAGSLDAGCYTDLVPSIADYLRSRTVAQMLALPMRSRIEMALSLGDDDLELFIRTSRLDRVTARERLRAGRRYGRTPSACADSA
jgi:hypothetical protein